MNYVISKARPISTVDDVAFIAMISGASDSKAHVMNGRKLKKMIELEKQNFENEVRALLSTVKYVCLTVDMWSTTHRAWFGMTCHWLDEEKIERKSVALCCKRMFGNYLNFYS